MAEKAFDSKLTFPVLLGFVVSVISLSGQFGTDWLPYNRLFIIQGQLWRVFTAHLTHQGFIHLALNLFGLLLVFILFGNYCSRRNWLFGFIFCMSGISSGLFISNPEIEWYMGLSGCLHGLTVIGIFGAIKNKQHLGYIGLFAVGLKLVIEQYLGSTMITADLTHSPTVIDAHLYGAVSGLLFAVILHFIKVPDMDTGKSSDRI